MFLHYLALVLETLFLIGMAGSLIVAIWAFVGDIHVFFEKDEVKEKEKAKSHAPAGVTATTSPTGAAVHSSLR